MSTGKIEERGAFRQSKPVLLSFFLAHFMGPRQWIGWGGSGST